MMSKSSLGRKVVSAKVTDWVNPSFDCISKSPLPQVSDRKPSACSKPSGGNQKILWTGSDKKFHSNTLNDAKSQKRIKVSHTDQILSHCRQNSTSEHSSSWVDEYKPQTQGELAVHKKKIEEVDSWLKSHTSETCRQQDGSILLLTGGSGTGKSATVHVLVKELGIQLQEWINPLSQDKFKPWDEFERRYNTDSGFQAYMGKPQSVRFEEFLLRASKYKKLQMVGDILHLDKKLILVEDIPNQFYREPSCLHDILRKFVQTARCPLVFIISDSFSGDSNQRLLFPHDIQQELGIFNIRQVPDDCFNPVAPTSMLKVLSRISAQEASKKAGKSVVPDKAVLEMLCKASAGDIRSAINSLQFTLVKGHPLEQIQLPKSKGKSSVRTGTSLGRKYKVKSSKAQENESALLAIGGKDQSLFLFRALGKIMYCKREPSSDVHLNPLPAHLSEHERDPLLVNPEEVIENSHMSEELFNLYLHQNYVDFFSDVDDIVRASEYLSDADFLTVDWSHRSTMWKYSASVATRGLIHANRARAWANCKGGAGFKPLHKPQWLSIYKKYKENCLAAKGFFSNFCLAPVCLQTELLPYLALLTNPMRNQAQINFIQDVGRFPFKRYSTRPALEALTDKDPGVVELSHEDEDCWRPQPLVTHEQTAATTQEPQTAGAAGQCGGGDLPSSQPQPTIAQAFLEDEELIIEEYDSD